jgi:Ni/Co efflux regulator RcnB
MEFDMRFPQIALVLALAAVAPGAMATKPDWAGKGGKHPHSEQVDQAEQVGRVEASITVGSYFGERQRLLASEYYESQSRSGKCPPGLAKKRNGCQPPGQAKKWHLGRPLPREVVFYPVPKEIVVRIGQPPAGYRYVRVLNDILLVAIGSQMVVDAIEDLMH